MPKNHVSVDEYIGKRSLVAKDGIIYRAAKMPKTFNAENRSATFVMTDETVDSYGDIVRAKGAKLDRFESNPICLLNHRADLPTGPVVAVLSGGNVDPERYLEFLRD